MTRSITTPWTNNNLLHQDARHGTVEHGRRLRWRSILVVLQLRWCRGMALASSSLVVSSFGFSGSLPWVPSPKLSLDRLSSSTFLRLLMWSTTEAFIGISSKWRHCQTLRVPSSLHWRNGRPNRCQKGVGRPTWSIGLGPLRCGSAPSSSTWFLHRRPSAPLHVGFRHHYPHKQDRGSSRMNFGLLSWSSRIFLHRIPDLATFWNKFIL
jgi:hypothetical protein